MSFDASKRKLSYFQAALAVLRVSERPLTVPELLDRMAAGGYRVPTGRTPENTLTAALYRHLGTHPALRRVFGVPTTESRRYVRWTVRRRSRHVSR